MHIPSFNPIVMEFDNEIALIKLVLEKIVDMHNIKFFLEMEMLHDKLDYMGKELCLYVLSTVEESKKVVYNLGKHTLEYELMLMKIS